MMTIKEKSETDSGKAAPGHVMVLITADIDPTPEMAMDEQNRGLAFTEQLLERFGIQATFFVVARIAEKFHASFARWIRMGHEIGCHGLTHHISEEYSVLPEPLQRENLTAATGILRSLTQSPVTSFRGPRVRTSHATQGVLEELGYTADVSVCSQRLDFISSNRINVKWITAPRLPYHPDVSDAFRRGERKLTVVPISALGAPFISGTLYTFGVTFMKLLFRIFYLESRRNGKPIVYLFHPQEFGFMPLRPLEKNAWKEFSISRFSIRRRLKLQRGPEIRLKMHEALFRYIASFPDIRFVTVRECVRSLENSAGSALETGQKKE